MIKDITGTTHHRTSTHLPARNLRRSCLLDCPCSWQLTWSWRGPAAKVIFLNVLFQFMDDGEILVHVQGKQESRFVKKKGDRGWGIIRSKVKKSNLQAPLNLQVKCCPSHPASCFSPPQPERTAEVPGCPQLFLVETACLPVVTSCQAGLVLNMNFVACILAAVF